MCFWISVLDLSLEKKQDSLCWVIIFPHPATTNVDNKRGETSLRRGSRKRACKKMAEGEARSCRQTQPCHKYLWMQSGQLVTFQFYKLTSNCSARHLCRLVGRRVWRKYCTSLSLLKKKSNVIDANPKRTRSGSKPYLFVKLLSLMLNQIKIRITKSSHVSARENRNQTDEKSKFVVSILLITLHLRIGNKILIPMNTLHNSCKSRVPFAEK